MCEIFNLRILESTIFFQAEGGFKNWNESASMHWRMCEATLTAGSLDRA